MIGFVVIPETFNTSPTLYPDPGLSKLNPIILDPFPTTTETFASVPTPEEPPAYAIFKLLYDIL